MNKQSNLTIVYRKHKFAILGFGLCLLLTAVLIALSSTFTRTSTALLPSDQQNLEWTLDPVSDQSVKGGNSEMEAVGSKKSISFTYQIRAGALYPFVSVVMNFDQNNNIPPHVDLSQYHTVLFKSRCSNPEDSVFSFHTIDPVLSLDPDLDLNFRLPAVPFRCEPEWNSHKFAIDELEIPDWWFHHHKIMGTSKAFDMSKVQAFSFLLAQTEHPEGSQFAEFKDIILIGEKRENINFTIVPSILIWIGYFILMVFIYRVRLKPSTNDLHLQKDESITRVKVAPKKDARTNEILQFLNREYPDPKLNLENACKTLKINRTKVNELLKSEVGLTFNGYLTELRLKEAAELLKNEPKVNISDVAYHVGFNNVSYFCKVFKENYKLTPKEYRQQWLER